jgi:hypothetical protein
MGLVDIAGIEELIGDAFVGDEYIGDDFVGDDIEGEYDDLVGARRRVKRAPARRKVPARSSAMAMALANKTVRGGAIVKEHGYTKSRQWILGLDSVTTVATLATVSITANPQMPFKPRRLSVLGSVASSFLIASLIIGNQPQFASLQFSVPADMFGPTAFGTDLNCDTAQANTNVQIQATNISGAALRFVAGVVGDAVA